MYCLNMLGMLPYSACAVYLQQRHSCLIGCVTGRERMHGLEQGCTRDGRQTCSFWKSALAEGLGSSEEYGARLCGRSSLTLVLSSRRSSALALASSSRLLRWRVLLGCCVPLLRCICRPGIFLSAAAMVF